VEQLLLGAGERRGVVAVAGEEAARPDQRALRGQRLAGDDAQAGRGHHAGALDQPADARPLAEMAEDQGLDRGAVLGTDVAAGAQIGGDDRVGGGRRTFILLQHVDRGREAGAGGHPQ